MCCWRFLWRPEMLGEHTQYIVYFAYSGMIASLRKLAHAKYRCFSPVKIENNVITRKHLIFWLYLLKYGLCYTLEPPRRGGSNEYTQLMFWIKNKINRYILANPIFTI